MKTRSSFVSNSSSTSFILDPKQEYRNEVIENIQLEMSHDDNWMHVWFHEEGRTITGAQESMISLLDVFLSHPQWFHNGTMHIDDYVDIFRLIKGKWLKIEPNWHHAKEARL